jgi:meso-butanediol dehydrogenase/(S,S)-butanediol dehydrogenase/diacetyl reductase
VGSRGVLIVGSGSAIARAIASRFAVAHDRIVGVDLKSVQEASLMKSLVSDCSKPDKARMAVEEASQYLGHLDVVIAAAASMPIAPAHETTDEQWRLALSATLDSTFFVARAALPLLRRGGCIVAVSSINSTLAAPGLPAYSAAKGGVEALVRQLALEYGPQGIRVNAVAPALIGRSDLPGASEGYPLGRIGDPQDVASAVYFLASEAASFITGVTLPVDGGLSVASPAAFLRPELRSRFLA